MWKLIYSDFQVYFIWKTPCKSLFDHVSNCQMILLSQHLSLNDGQCKSESQVHETNNGLSLGVFLQLCFAELSAFNNFDFPDLQIIILSSLYFWLVSNAY